MAKIAKDITKALLAEVEKFSEKLDRSLAEELAVAVKGEMINLISKGISPIEPGGRFPGYKNQGEPGRYPLSARSNYPSKAARPVNLFLSGSFMFYLASSAAHRVKSIGKRMKIEIGFFDSGKGSQSIKEEGHRKGGSKKYPNSQPKRPIIPLPSESFSRKIQATVISVLKKRFG